MAYFDSPLALGKKQVKGRFAIPSGIRCVRASTIAKCFEEVPAVGVITTKSISVAPRAGYREPIYARFAAGSYINAVGLSNPGAEQFLKELRRVQVPQEKFLLVSIFGSNAAEFQEAARILSPVADGFELNLSCPHASGYGLEIGQDVPLASSIVQSVANASGVPVFAKLSTSMLRIGETAKAMIAAGAAGITVSNTAGPATVFVGEKPVLYNGSGGLSGNAVRPLALLGVKTIREAVGSRPIILGMGGIGTAEHVRQFRSAGADVFGIGSAVTGLDSEQMRAFFASLRRDLAGEASPLGSESPDAQLAMNYHRARVVQRRDYGADLFELRLDSLPGDPNNGDLSGRYYFLFVPGAGEKPFAIFSAQDRSIVIRKAGIFTGQLAELPLGSEILVRGPYGKKIVAMDGVDHYVMVGGGTGIASLPEIARELCGHGAMQFVLGARTGEGLFGVEEFEALGEVKISTDDGSRGYKGQTPELLTKILDELAARGKMERAAVISCGPDPMVHACIGAARRYLPNRQIIGSIEYPTSCGVGICGKCASPSGHLTCIDGPFLCADAFDSVVTGRAHFAGSECPSVS